MRFVSLLFFLLVSSFLWKLSSEHQPTLPKIKVFPWTGKNDYMILCNTTFIAMGGG